MVDAEECKEFKSARSTRSESPKKRKLQKDSSTTDPKDNAEDYGCGEEKETRGRKRVRYVSPLGNPHKTISSPANCLGATDNKDGDVKPQPVTDNHIQTDDAKQDPLADTRPFVAEMKHMRNLKSQYLDQERAGLDVEGHWDKELEWAQDALEWARDEETLGKVYEILGFEVIERRDAAI